MKTEDHTANRAMWLFSIFTAFDFHVVCIVVGASVGAADRDGTSAGTALTFPVLVGNNRKDCSSTALGMVQYAT